MRKLLVLVVVAACGNDSGSGPIPIDGLADAVLNTYCDVYVRCGVVPDLASCRSALTRDLHIDPDLVAAVAAGKIVYHGDQAELCVNALAGTTCDRSLLFSSRNQPEACDLTFEGTVPEGGACALKEECISQSCSIPSCPANTCCQGTCVGSTPPMRAPLGGSCANGIKCAEGYCDSMSTTCQAFLADGSPCTSSASCASGTCNTTCQTLVAPGGACTSSTMCRDIGDSCIGATAKTCTAYVALGAACGPTTADCMPLYTCDATQHCAAKPVLGEACSSTNSCIDASYCDATTMKCTSPKADGAPCMSTNECQSRNCDSTTNTCTTPAICI